MVSGLTRIISNTKKLSHRFHRSTQIFSPRRAQRIKALTWLVVSGSGLVVRGAYVVLRRMVVRDGAVVDKI